MRMIDADALINEAMELYCKDCERRKGVKSGKWKIVYNIGDAPCRACGTGDMIDDLENAPTIEERKKGKWKRAYLDHEAMGERPSILYCSICNQCIAYPTNYCPNCGADMRGEQDG